jgi:hypothetical protein
MADIVASKKREVGRPCKYESHVEPRLQEIYQWVKEGMTDYSIADQLGICHETLIKYKDNYSDLSSLYARALTERVKLVQNRQFAKACGVIQEVRKAKVLNDGTVIEYTEEAYTPPDTNAAEFWSRHNDPGYIPPRTDARSLSIVQNNYNLEDWQTKRQEILQEIKKLETIATTDFKVLDTDSD